MAKTRPKPSPTTTTTTPTTLTTEDRCVDRVSRIRRMLEENEQSDLYSPNYVSRKPWDLAVKRTARTGAEADKSFFNPTRAFKDMKISVEDAIEQGDKVVIRWRLQGIWAGAVGDIKATGRPINVTGTNFYRFVGDKIVEEDGEMDWASFAQQAFGGASAGPGLAEACSSSFELVSRPPEKFRGGGPV
jgi:ketosteroid isomerase-like protein